MNPLKQLQFALRSLRRAPLFSLTVVTTLFVGAAAATAIFTVVDAVLLRPLPYPHAEQLVDVWMDLPGVHVSQAGQSLGTYYTFRRLAHSASDLATYNDGPVTVSDPAETQPPARLRAAFATASLFKVLDVSTIRGRTYTTAEDAPNGPSVAVIREDLWRTRFGSDVNIVGKTLNIGGRATEIIGVMPAAVRFPNADTQIWLPAQLNPADPFPGGFGQDVVARLRAGVTLDAAQRDFAAVLPMVKELYPNILPGVTMASVFEEAHPAPRLVPLRMDAVGAVAPVLWAVAGAAVLILLVTAANAANLFVVRADRRHRELSVRAALGAGRGQLVGHFLAESGVVVSVASALAVVATLAIVNGLVALAPSDLPRLSEIHVGAPTVAFAMVLTAILALVCSMLPALHFMRTSWASGVRDGERAGSARTRQRVRHVLVAAQMAVACCALVGSGLLLRSSQKLHAVRAGFDARNVATVWIQLPRARYKSDTSDVRFYRELTARAARVSGVEAVGVTSHLPLVGYGWNADPFYAEGAASKAIPPMVGYSSVDAGFFDALKIPLIAGRPFDQMGALRDTSEALIGLQTAKHFFGDSTGRAAIGRRFRTLPNAPWHTIVGVVGDLRDTSLAGPPTEAVYFPEDVTPDTLDGRAAATMALVVRTTASPATTLRAVESEIHSMDPTLAPFQARSMSGVIADSMARLTFVSLVFAAAAIVTLLLGLVGLYGVLASVVSLRTREIGLRIALGATRRDVVSAITRQGLLLGASGLAAGLMLSLLVARALGAFLFGVMPFDPATLLMVAGVQLALAVVAAGLPARRAANIHPIEALRAD